MAQLIKTKTELNQILTKKLMDAINIVGKQIEEQLKKNIIEHVYNVEPNKWYNPTHEFYDSFNWEKARKEINGIVRGQILYNYFKMSLPIPDDTKGSQLPYQHGNIWAKNKDIRNKLAAFLNIDGHNRGLPMFQGKQREPFFDITLEWIDKNFDSMVKNAFLKVGLHVSKR